MSSVAIENSLSRQTSYSVLSLQRFFVVIDFSRISVVTENPGIWDFPCRDNARSRRVALERA